MLFPTCNLKGRLPFSELGAIGEDMNMPHKKKKDTKPKMKGRETAEIKNRNPLPKIEPLPGAVCVQMKRCGKPNCRCAKGELHGPFHYWFYRAGGKLYKQYVRKADVSLMQARCLAYRVERQELREIVRASNAYMRRIRAFLRENSL